MITMAATLRASSNDSVQEANFFLSKGAGVLPSGTPLSKSGDRLNDLDDQRIKEIKPLVPPQILMEDVPLTLEAYNTIILARQQASNIVKGADDRLLVIVGPCSIDNPKAALEYAALLKGYADKAAEDLLIVMRVYFEKPRTTVGWKGLINDPFLNGSFKINIGLRMARELLLHINMLGMPTGYVILFLFGPSAGAHSGLILGKDASSWILSRRSTLAIL
jgi:hypothetical protein